MFAGNFGLTRDNFDPDANTYIQAVETADGQALEAEVKRAITRFVKGCKNDNIWTAIKACCILSGARTLTGSLVPLKGTAPTNVNFVSGDYDRKTGLKGNGTTKYLNTNRNSNVDPQNSIHLVVYQSFLATTGVVLIGDALNPRTAIYVSSHAIRTSGTFTSPSPAVLGFVGASRSNSFDYQVRANSTTGTVVASSSTVPGTNAICVFARTVGGHTDPRIGFYSVGEAVDLALFQSRVDALISSFNNFIP